MPIVIPAAVAPVRRPPVPFVAALVPIAAGVVLWLITGSVFALCFAALGPLMIVASLLDGARSRRKTLRAAIADSEAAWVHAESELVRRQEEERTRRWHRHPDAAAALIQAPLRGPQAPDVTTEVVIGSGVVPSGIRSTGGDGERAREFQVRAGKLDAAPMTVPLGGGICVRSGAPLAAAAARAIVVQLCLRFSAGQLAVVGESLDVHGLSDFPQARTRRRGLYRVGVAVVGAARPDADAVIWILGRAEDVPEGITTVIDITEPRRATLRTPQGIADVTVECLSREQAMEAAQMRADVGEDLDVLPDAVALSDLDQPASADGLPVAIGRGERMDIVLDIVEDGPHAIVTGTTGTGKSELLVSWVTAMAAQHGPDRVTFVLADFKGGTAFEPLRELPQVAAVITDLDDVGARRGVSSLTAELRRRESILAAAGVRDVRDAAMPRLVIVVDEFAALLQEHPDLGAVFTDIAARGRALGMHLIIGTQRASGVIRDALSANCPLRVSLRVGDPSDSRLVIGTDAAAELPGGVASRGLALSRRPQDVEPVPMRVALTGAADLRRIGMRWADAVRPRSPWLPALPALLPLAALLPETPEGTLVLGRSDDPDHQQQPLEVIRVGRDRGLVLLGGPGSGRTSALRALMAQRPDALWVPADSEAAWDALCTLTGRRGKTPALVLCDDLDSQIDALPLEHAQQFGQRWEQLLRGATETTFVITAGRATGAVSRLFDALPRRALLRMPSRVEHLAAGGDSAGFHIDRLPGRARIGNREVQLAWVDDDHTSPRSLRADSRAHRRWEPRGLWTAIVTSGASGVRDVLAAAYPDCEVKLAPVENVDTRVPMILVAEAEVWQRNWALWQRVRREGEVLIRAENAVDLRQLAGVRDLPPFARPHAGRVWSLVGDDAPRRVVLPSLSRP